MESKPIVMCLLVGEGQCCIGKECPLYKKCFTKEDRNEDEIHHRPT